MDAIPQEPEGAMVGPRLRASRHWLSAHLLVPGRPPEGHYPGNGRMPQLFSGAVSMPRGPRAGYTGGRWWGPAKSVGHPPRKTCATLQAAARGDTLAGERFRMMPSTAVPRRV
jgi:hypothetical protein